MKKEKLLYASPFPPQRSGISDYSETLVYALRDFFDITLLIDRYELSNEALYRDFEVLVYQISEIDFKKYNYIIYNIGNNPHYHSYIYELCLTHPGMVIQHDLVLYYLIVGYYEQRGELFSKIYEIGGADAIACVKRRMKAGVKSLLEYKDIAPKLPLNKELAQSGNKIMVHSEYTRQHLIAQGMEPQRIRKINHLILQTDANVVIQDRSRLFRKYGIPEDALIISSFGFIAETKLNDRVCEAVKRLAEKLDKKICYVMVGDGNFADRFLDNKMIFKTGYADMDEFISFLQYSDIVANLRYPSMGETSGAMIRVMEYGKPAIIVSNAWFAEIPKDCVVSLEVDELEKLEERLEQLIINEAYRIELGKKAKAYVYAEYSADVVCRNIGDFLRD